MTETVAVTGLGRGLSAGLRPWRRPTAVHDPGKVVAVLAIALALGGDCLADVGLLPAEPGLYGPVASDATVSRTIAALAADATKVLAAIDTARAAARAAAWGDGTLLAAVLDRLTALRDSGAAPWKFAAQLPAQDSELAQPLTRDPYVLDRPAIGHRRRRVVGMASHR